MSDFSIQEMLAMQRTLQEKYKINGKQFVRKQGNINCYGWLGK